MAMEEPVRQSWSLVDKLMSASKASVQAFGQSIYTELGKIHSLGACLICGRRNCYNPHRLSS